MSNTTHSHASVPYYTLVIPVFNEKESIKDVILDCHKAFLNSKAKDTFEILVINDGSTDETASIIEQIRLPQIRVITQPKRRGVGIARSTGVLHARGKKVLLIDADMTYTASDIPRMIELLDSHDMVVGARTEEKGTLPFLRQLVKDLFRTLASWLTSTSIPDLNTGYRGMDTEKTKEFLYMLPPGHSWVSTITLCFLASGYSVCFMPTQYHERRGRSSFNVIRDTHTFFLTIIKTIMYFYPLRVLLPISYFFFGLSLFFLLRDLVQCNLSDTTVFSGILGIIMFIFALLSEQIACLRRELKQKVY